MQQIILDVIPHKVSPYCYVLQDSSGDTIEINLVYGDEVYSLDGTENISLEIRRPDGQILVKSLNSFTGTKITFTTTADMTPIIGFNVCNITIAKTNMEISTLNFIMAVEYDF